MRGKTYETFQRAKKNVFRENDKIERKIENLLDNSGLEDLFIP